MARGSRQIAGTTPPGARCGLVDRERMLASATAEGRSRGRALVRSLRLADRDSGCHAVRGRTRGRIARSRCPTARGGATRRGARDRRCGGDPGIQLDVPVPRDRDRSLGRTRWRDACSRRAHRARAGAPDRNAGRGLGDCGAAPRVRREARGGMRGAPGREQARGPCDRACRAGSGGAHADRRRRRAGAPAARTARPGARNRCSLRRQGRSARSACMDRGRRRGDSRLDRRRAVHRLARSCGAKNAGGAPGPRTSGCRGFLSRGHGCPGFVKPRARQTLLPKP